VPIPTAIEVLDGKGNTDPIRVDTPPGEARRYSGGGYTVAQQLMVDATGGKKSFAELMKETVLEPLAMNDSTYEQPLPDVLHSRAATGYRGDGRRSG
jgi:CubicO group peptidase (beta-lactamase class C family)